MAFEPQGQNSASFRNWEDQVIAGEQASAAIRAEFASDVNEAAGFINQAPKWMDRETLIEFALEQIEGVNADNYAAVSALLAEGVS